VEPSSGNSTSENQNSGDPKVNPSKFTRIAAIFNPEALLRFTFGVLTALLVVGIILIVSRPPSGHPVALRQPPVLVTSTPAPLVVHVVGAVSLPGVYEIPAGGRLQDAIEAAGGLLPNADTQALNLAALLQDGIQLVIPTKLSNLLDSTGSKLGGIDLGSGVGTGTPYADSSTVFTPTPGGLININIAGLAELDSLPGIGPVIAQNIIDYRIMNGPFISIEDIQKVSGIGPSKYEAIKDLITVGGP
jgi:competence protein ComEA